MPLSQKEVRDVLIQKFGLQEIKKTRHNGLTLIHDERKIATTWFSRASGRTIGDSLLTVMARELRIDQLSFFKEMISCTKSREDYLNLLRTKGYLKD